MPGDLARTNTGLAAASNGATYPEIAVNAALVLAGVARALLDRQIDAQAAAFEREGGFTERRYRLRSPRRGWSGKKSWHGDRAL